MSVQITLSKFFLKKSNEVKPACPNKSGFVNDSKNNERSFKSNTFKQCRKVSFLLLFQNDFDN